MIALSLEVFMNHHFFPKCLWIKIYFNINQYAPKIVFFKLWHQKVSRKLSTTETSKVSFISHTPSKFFTRIHANWSINNENITSWTLFTIYYFSLPYFSLFYSNSATFLHFHFAFCHTHYLILQWTLCSKIFH